MSDECNRPQESSGVYQDACGRDVCPNCGKTVETHEMFNPPRCPVVRLKFPPEATEPFEEIVLYSKADRA
jgi:hypothetical protein